MFNANNQGGASTTISFDPKELRTSQPGDEEVTLRDRQGMEHSGKVTCGTFSSLAVILDHGTFSDGDAIEADYGGATIPAVVRHAYRQPDGKWIVILRWGQ